MSTALFQRFITPRFWSLERLSHTFDAIGHDCRLEIVLLLTFEETLPSGEIARLTNCSPSATSQHLNKLVNVGLLDCEREGKETHYFLNKAHPFLDQLIALSRTALN